MTITDLTLSDLAMSSTIYNLTSFNDSLGDLKEATKTGIDLNNADHRTSLITWLNKWGCRLAIEHLETTSGSIQDWYKQAVAGLFPITKAVWELNDNDLGNAATAYGTLKDKVAAQRDRDTKVSDRNIGPTAASKVLFAIRPNALMPWDEAMRKGFDCNGSHESYLKFLREIRNMAWKIRDLCNTNGFDVFELPVQIERPDSTVLEIINEYIWVKVTRKCKLPPASTLKRWAEWQ